MDRGKRPINTTDEPPAKRTPFSLLSNKPLQHSLPTLLQENSSAKPLSKRQIAQRDRREREKTILKENVASTINANPIAPYISRRARGQRARRERERMSHDLPSSCCTPPTTFEEPTALLQIQKSPVAEGSSVPVDVQTIVPPSLVTYNSHDQPIHNLSTRTSCHAAIPDSLLDEVREPVNVAMMPRIPSSNEVCSSPNQLDRDKSWDVHIIKPVPEEMNKYWPGWGVWPPIPPEKMYFRSGSWRFTMMVDFETKVKFVTSKYVRS